jgi:hypothetical protein
MDIKEFFIFIFCSQNFCLGDNMRKSVELDRMPFERNSFICVATNLLASSVYKFSGLYLTSNKHQHSKEA